MQALAEMFASLPPRRDGILAVRFARRALHNVIPFNEWKAKRNPTPLEVEFYHLVVAGLKRIAAIETDDENSNTIHQSH